MLTARVLPALLLGGFLTLSMMAFWLRLVGFSESFGIVGFSFWALVAFPILLAAVIIGLPNYRSLLLSLLMAAMGTSLAFLGNQAATYQAQLVDYIVSVIALILLVEACRSYNVHVISSPVGQMLMCFVIICTFSLLVLPFPAFDLFSFKHFDLVAWSVSQSSAEVLLYPYSSVLRLVTFTGIAFLLAGIEDAKRHLTSCFLGVLTGTLVACCIGLAEHLNLIAAPLDRLDTDRMQAVFGHPGWFAEFVTVSIPFILILFSRWENSFLRISLFGFLVVCEVVLILAQARAGWIVYPITLIFCWAAYYGFFNAERSQIEYRKFARIAISVPVTLLLSLILVLVLNEMRKEDVASTVDADHVSDRLAQRAENLFNANDRLTQWISGVQVARESPFVGTGYDAFRWNADVLRQDPESYLGIFERELFQVNNLPTPHNFYVNLIASVGLIGFIVWLAVVFAAGLCLVRSVLADRDGAALGALISIVSFHIYGVFQSMQYISVVWFLIFLSFSYALSSVPKLLPTMSGGWKEQGEKYLLNCVLLFTAIAAAIYVGKINTSGQQLRTVTAQAGSFDFDRRMGFHRLENWDGATFAWMRKKALIMPPAGARFVNLPIEVINPDIAERPLIVSMYVQDNQIFKEEYRSIGRRSVLVDLGSNSSVPIEIRVSSTFKIGSDPRELGIAVGMPEAEMFVGFYAEEYTADSKFYWSKQTSWICPAKENTNVRFTMSTANPEIEKNSVLVELSSNDVEESILLSSYASVQVEWLIRAKSDCLKFFVHSPWRPADHDPSSRDARTLGVKVEDIRMDELEEEIF